MPVIAIYHTDGVVTRVATEARTVAALQAGCLVYANAPAEKLAALVDAFGGSARHRSELDAGLLQEPSWRLRVGKAGLGLDKDAEEPDLPPTSSLVLDSLLDELRAAKYVAEFKAVQGKLPACTTTTIEDTDA